MRCRQGLFRCGIVGNACCVRATHLSSASSYLCDVSPTRSRARVRGRAGRSVEERNRRRCFDREANRRSQPAFRAPGGRGGWFRRRVSAIVILKSSPLPLSPSLAFSTPLNFLLVVDHQRGFLVWSSVSSLILKNVSLLRFLHD